jgi:undecaprenyl diphosphate synthase
MKGKTMRMHKEGGPVHVGLIMDGNGRWAQRQKMPRAQGHLEGAKALERVVKAAPDLGIRELSAYVFSTENWTRPASEVEHIMGMFLQYLRKFGPEAARNGVRVRIIGNRDDDRISPVMRRAMNKVEQLTVHGDVLTLNLAFNYGGDSDFVRGVQGLTEAVMRGELPREEITAEAVRRYSYSGDVRDMDLLIRTGGELRFSNFLPWQVRYAELYFTDVCWPEFSGAHLQAAVEEFKNRHRTFGAVVELAEAS